MLPTHIDMKVCSLFSHDCCGNMVFYGRFQLNQKEERRKKKVNTKKVNTKKFVEYQLNDVPAKSIISQYRPDVPVHSIVPHLHGASLIILLLV